MVSDPKLSQRQETKWQRAVTFQHRVAMVAFSVPLAVIVALVLRANTPEVFAMELDDDTHVESTGSVEPVEEARIRPRQGAASQLVRTLRAGIEADNVFIANPREARDLQRFLETRSENDNWVLVRDENDPSGNTFEIVTRGSDRPLLTTEREAGEYYVVGFKVLRARTDTADMSGQK